MVLSFRFGILVKNGVLFSHVHFKCVLSYLAWLWCIEYSDEKKQAIKKYEALINEYYKEPVQGEFEDATILERIRSDTEELTQTWEKICKLINLNSYYQLF